MSTGIEIIDLLGSDRVVDNRTYTEPRIYDRERRRIFSSSWQFVCHVSDLSEPGDFVTATVAHNPILITRARDGRLRAMHNACRHRGARVVGDCTGHASTLRCPYHFWTYGLDGALLGVPGEEAYDGTGFDKTDFPLLPVTVEAVLGLVFVHLGQDPAPLEAWVGPELLDVLRVPLASAELEVMRRSSEVLPLNWKVFAENQRDGYHVPFVHPFFRKASPPGTYHLHRNSHAVQHLGMDFSQIEPVLAADLQTAPLPGVEIGQGYIVNLFPDIAITLRSNVVSIDWQEVRGVNEVVMRNLTLGLVGDDEETRRLRALSHDTWFKNPVELEDQPVFLAQQAGVASEHMRYSIIARGTQSDTGTRGDDNRLRHFWVTWRRLMGVEANSVPDDCASEEQS